MPGITWTKQGTLLLIEKIQNYEFLYNVDDAQYIDRVKKLDAYNKLCIELKNVVNNLTPTDVKKKIHTLRTQYVKELRMVDASKKSGCAVNDIYEPKLWCFDMMDFLRPHCYKRNRSTNIEEKSTDCSDDETCSPKPSHPEKMMKHDTETTVSSILNEVKGLIAKRMNTPKPEYKWLGDLVLFQMANIRSTVIKRKTAWAIQNLLNEALAEDVDPTPLD